MTYWLQELQQKRWEYCNGLDMVKWDSGTSLTLGDFSKGLVARDTTGKSQVEGPVSLLCVSPCHTASPPGRAIQNATRGDSPFWMGSMPPWPRASRSRMVSKPNDDQGSQAGPAPCPLKRPYGRGRQVVHVLG